MKKRLIVLAALGLFIAYAIVEQQSSTLVRNRSGEPPFDMAIPKNYIAAEQLYRMASADPNVIRDRYANQLIGVSGKVLSFEKGWRNERFLLLDAGPAKPALRLGLEPDSRTSAKYAATPNTHAKLGCKYLGVNESDGRRPYLNECYFYTATK